MNAHAKIEPVRPAVTVATLRFAAHELYEAAYALECDWDSRRTPHRQERLANAVAEMRKRLEAVDA